MIIATGIFLGVLTMTTSIFLKTVQAQRKYFLAQNIQENARFFMDYALKELRMSRFPNGTPLEGIAADKQLLVNIFNEDSPGPGGSPVRYLIYNPSQITRVSDSGWDRLTGNNVYADGSFYETGQHPRYTVSVKIWPNDGSGATEPSVVVENTVSTRYYVY